MVLNTSVIKSLPITSLSSLLTRIRWLPSAPARHSHCGFSVYRVSSKITIPKDAHGDRITIYNLFVFLWEGHSPLQTAPLPTLWKVHFGYGVSSLPESEASFGRWICSMARLHPALLGKESSCCYSHATLLVNDQGREGWNIGDRRKGMEPPLPPTCTRVW